MRKIMSSLAFAGQGCWSSTVMEHQYVPQWSLLTVHVPCLQTDWSNALFLHILTQPSFGSLTFQSSKSKWTELMNLIASLDFLLSLYLGYLAFFLKNAVNALSRHLRDCCSPTFGQSFNQLYSSWCFKTVSCFASSRYVILSPCSLYADVLRLSPQL